MKTLKILFTLSLAGACMLASGCHKQKNTASAGSAPISTVDSGGPMEMKIKWEVGKKYDQEMSVKQMMHMENFPGAPKQMDQENNTVMDFSMAVTKSLPDGGVQVEMTITGYKMESKMNGKTTLSFDSNQDNPSDKNPTTAVFGKLIGGHVTYQADADGKVAGVTGMDDLMARMGKSNPQTDVQVKAFFSEDMLKQMAMRGQGLPDHPVKIGDHWPYHMDLATSGAAGKLKLDLDYNFKGWQQHGKRKCALLEFIGHLSTIPGTGDGAMKVSIEKGNVSGYGWFDPELGMIVDSVSDTPMTLNLVVKGKSLAMEMKQSTTVKLTEFADIPK